MRLAFYLLADPKMVIVEHGAMTPLTGCEEYSCPLPPPDEVLERLDAIAPGWRKES